MPKRRKSRKSKSSKRSASGGCCPVIRVKCSMKRPRGGSAPGPASAQASLRERLKAFKAAKELREQAAMGGLGSWKNINPAALARVKRAADAVKSAARHGGMCTVKVGSSKSRRMKASAAGSYVASLVKAQKARRCAPLVLR